MYQNNSITELSKVTSIPYNVLINLGFVRNLKFDTVVKGKVNPSNKVTDDHWIMQAHAIGSYINSIATKFNRLIRCVTIGMHADFEEFCKTRHEEVKNLTLIDLTDFMKEKSVRKLESPRLYANWMLVSMCSMLLNIYKSKVSGKIAQRFVDIFVTDIMEAELNMSKPELYKKVVAAAKALTDNITYTPVEMNEDDTDTSAKDFICGLDGETFSTSELDVDYAGANGSDVI